MSDEALNKHLDWLDECDKARAKAAENEIMAEHVCKWVLGDIDTTCRVRVGYVCESPSCGEFLTVTQVGVRLNATERLRAEGLAIRFHDYYEELAPSFGYVTREETRCFDANSKNGKLMVAVAGKVIIDILEGKDD